jgi:hypothetical protein
MTEKCPRLLEAVLKKFLCKNQELKFLSVMRCIQAI